MSESATLQQILRFLQENVGGKTLNQIAAALDIHIQTARTHVQIGIEKGLIEQAGKVGKAYLYKASLVNIKSSPRILWQGHAVSMADLIMAWASDPANKLPKTTHGKFIAGVIVELFKYAVNSTIEDDPKLPSFLILKELRSNIMTLMRQMKDDFATLETLINNESIWNPRELGNALILKEEEYSPLQIKMATEELVNIAKKGRID